MKKYWPWIVIAVCLIMVWLFAGCVSCGPCPAQDSVILIRFQGVPVPVGIPKGFLDDTEKYYTKEEWKKVVEDWDLNNEEEKNSL